MVAFYDQFDGIKAISGAIHVYLDGILPSSAFFK
jgi:hypothetical protein